ncbi:unnamed protein product [Ixodes pacificus]
MHLTLSVLLSSCYVLFSFSPFPLSGARASSTEREGFRRLPSKKRSKKVGHELHTRAASTVAVVKPEFRQRTPQLTTTTATPHHPRDNGQTNTNLDEAVTNLCRLSGCGNPGLGRSEPHAAVSSRRRSRSRRRSTSRRRFASRRRFRSRRRSTSRRREPHVSAPDATACGPGRR